MKDASSDGRTSSESNRLTAWALFFSLECVSYAILTSDAHIQKTSLIFLVNSLNGVVIFLWCMRLRVRSPLKNDLILLCALDVAVQVFGFVWHRTIYPDDIYYAANSAVHLLKMLRIFWLWRNGDGYEAQWRYDPANHAKSMGLVFAIVLSIPIGQYWSTLQFVHQAALNSFLLLYLIHKKQIESDKKASLYDELAKVKSDLEDVIAVLRDANHDLLQPVTSMSCNLFALGDAIENNEFEQAATIQRELVKGLQKIRDRIESNLYVAKLVTFTAQVTLEKLPAIEVEMMLIDDFSSAAKHSGFVFSTCVHDIILLTDRQILLRILENLIANAIKHSTGRKIAVLIRKRANVASIEVWDSGSKHDVASFEELLVVGASKSRLGLKITQELAKIIGTKITLICRKKGGMIFRFDVPISSR